MKRKSYTSFCFPGEVGYLVGFVFNFLSESLEAGNMLLNVEKVTANVS